MGGCREVSEGGVLVGVRRFAVVGNPNCGKTTLFNALTGLKQKVGNYPGVTVERKEGSVRSQSTGQSVTLIDLPGLYSLTPRSPDETIARNVLLGRRGDEPQPDGIVNVVDASNLISTARTRPPDGNSADHDRCRFARRSKGQRESA